jgi:oligopeptide/dipeptide ABC transporter ATP-binding protein
MDTNTFDHKIKSGRAEDTPLVQIKGLKKYFKVGGQTLKAVDNLSIDIYKGEILGLVGESGCGKSTAGRTIIRLYEPTEGEVLFEGENIYQYPENEMKKMRKEMQIIFQDPYASLDPRMNVLDIVGEPLDIHNLASGRKRRNRVQRLLELVGLDAEHMDRFPHEFSGGQRQRIGIARALAVEPKFIICDEPISALDVSIQAQVINLLKELQSKMDLTYMIIAHDLSMVRYVSDRILVMYLGKMVELAESERLYEKHYHPYTQALLSAVPIPDPKVERKRERVVLEGEVPSPINPPSGCVFRTRCPKAMDICSKVEPKWKEIDSGHFAACHLY